nr:hypothetical protein [Bacteroidales bacterium]
GGERIFSREKTKQLVDSALAVGSDVDFISLGKIIADEVLAQDTRGSEYVNVENGGVYAKQGARLDVFKELGAASISDVIAILSKHGYSVSKD